MNANGQSGAAPTRPTGNGNAVRIAVSWTVYMRREGVADDEILTSRGGRVTHADLEAAFQYAAAHKEVIDLAIAENEDGEEGPVE